MGNEEYWFYKNGCSLNFVDIDEYLMNLPECKEGLTYFIVDANDFDKQTSIKSEICYFSSFTPDEIRRQDIIKDYIKNNSDTSYVSWPQDENPFSELVMSITKNNLSNGGLFISQSYLEGIDIKSNPMLLIF